MIPASKGQATRYRAEPTNLYDGVYFWILGVIGDIIVTVWMFSEFERWLAEEGDLFQCQEKTFPVSEAKLPCCILGRWCL